MVHMRTENNPANRALVDMSSPNRNDPATKGDIEDLHTKVDRIHDDLNARMDRMHDDLVEKMRDMQTEVLRAFHSWARPVEIRIRSLDERVGLLEERVSAIERRHN